MLGNDIELLRPSPGTENDIIGIFELGDNASTVFDCRGFGGFAVDVEGAGEEDFEASEAVGFAVGDVLAWVVLLGLCGGIGFGGCCCTLALWGWSFGFLFFVVFVLLVVVLLGLRSGGLAL